MNFVMTLAGLAVSVLCVGGCAAPDGADDVASTDDELTAAAPLGAKPRGSAARHPIVLAHGFLGNGEGLASFDARIAEALERDGHVVVTASVPPLGSVRIRAKAIASRRSPPSRRLIAVRASPT